MNKLLWSVALMALMGIGVWTGLKASARTGTDVQTQAPAINCCDDPSCPPVCSPECPPDCCPEGTPCPFCK
jgi:hypothetical protein